MQYFYNQTSSASSDISQARIFLWDQAFFNEKGLIKRDNWAIFSVLLLSLIKLLTKSNYFTK